MTVLYFGIYRSDFGRNQVYIEGLRRAGHTVVECNDFAPGLAKFVRLYRKHRALHGRYDALVVGCYGHAVVPFARLISRKPILADLVRLIEDMEYYSHTQSIARRVKNRIIDWLAIVCADRVLVESEAQRQFCISRYGSPGKFSVLYTGTDEHSFYCDSDARESSPSVVLFRGRLTPESGIETVLAAARLLRSDARIRFRIIGYGYRLGEVEETIRTQNLRNVELISRHLSFHELRTNMCGALVSLGQFSDNPRLARAIPHKAFESMHMGLPYVTGPGAIEEILADGISCAIVGANDPAALAQKITDLVANPVAARRLATSARTVYEDCVSQRRLGSRLAALVESIRNIRS